jgi:hypothetical protein
MAAACSSHNVRTHLQDNTEYHNLKYSSVHFRNWSSEVVGYSINTIYSQILTIPHLFLGAFAELQKASSYQPACPSARMEQLGS